MTTTIRLADYQNPQDAADVMMLLNEYSKDPMGGGEELSDFVKTNLITNLIKQSNVFSVVCYVDDKPAGLVNCVDGFSTFAAKPLVNVHDVVVLKDYRRQGISTAMLNKVEEIARAKGCCKLTLEVLEGNEAAKKSYLHIGYEGYELDPIMGKAMCWQKKLK